MEPSAGRGRHRAVLVVVALAALAAAGVGAAALLRPAPPPSAPPPRPSAEVRLVTVGPGAAQVIVDGDVLGTLTREEDGTIHGEAIGRLAFRTRRLAGRQVEVRRDPEVPLEIALGVQRLLVLGGVPTPVLAEPE
ncbi:MAG: hypothetical protein M9894_26265 [Planctomycetes bacterium]|nr:hypothetical protein [Planctomycetota bacterium]